MGQGVIVIMKSFLVIIISQTSAKIIAYVESRLKYNLQ